MKCSSCSNSLESREIYFCLDKSYCKHCSPWRESYVSIIPRNIPKSDSSFDFKDILKSHENFKQPKNIILKGVATIVIYFCIRLSSST
jgi:hypothetical protein|uniref:Uncharacterized protein n=1 Tax=viral metagenome TaxID=1070528 RepID=A0A6C0AW75_9ZZZZ